ncbi:hypothetical protein [Acidihalobacter ferrooxydans]|uniref:phosphomannomutase n=1 Tax=Acidihalobacter ferrooxydans TaxID=1765967 RepID=A0A1P8UF54_9GAMM|nr:hypothetical protein [Acidihalobacter ferrooxydans]APZ42429.1 hypothetical protein BW247_04445 [Acidihalobacter ferrooxydans]
METASLSQLQDLIDGYSLLGRTGQTLRCRQIMPLACAFGDLLAPGDGTFAIGYDIRETSPSLAEAVSLGLRSGGHHVTHIGACTTPQLEWYVADAGLNGGIMVTGDCAPTDWNGMRLCGRGAAPVAAAQVIDAMTVYDLNDLFRNPCNPVLRRAQPQAAYAAWLRQQLRPQRLFKLCLDAGNGLTGTEFDAVMPHYRLLRLWRLGFKPDSKLPTRGPDPFSPQARAAVGTCVSTNGCHLGASLNANGDLLAITDERGQPVSPHAIGTVLALALAQEQPGLHVVHDSGLPPQMASALTRAGLTTDALPGGPAAAWTFLHAGRPGLYFDAAGHYASSDFPGTANALLALIMLINHLTAIDSPLSALVAALEPEAATD